MPPAASICRAGIFIRLQRILSKSFYEGQISWFSFYCPAAMLCLPDWCVSLVNSRSSSKMGILLPLPSNNRLLFTEVCVREQQFRKLLTFCPWHLEKKGVEQCALSQASAFTRLKDFCPSTCVFRLVKVTKAAGITSSCGGRQRCLASSISPTKALSLAG